MKQLTQYDSVRAELVFPTVLSLSKEAPGDLRATLRQAQVVRQAHDARALRQAQGERGLSEQHWHLTPSIAAILLALASGAQAQSLPAPPLSPAPITKYEYDAQGNPTKTVQAPGTLNLSTQASYDSLSRLKDSTDAKLGKTQLSYDGLDRTLKITDPRNLVTQTPRNGLGDATQLISPDTGTANHTFDAAGNLKTRTDSRGVKATHSYDALNRLTRVAYSQGAASQAYSWAYDQVGASYTNGIGRLTSSTHPAGSTTTRYDPQGRVTADIQRVNPAAGANPALVSKTVTYTVDAAGHVTSIVYPSGRKLSISYAAGRPTAMSLAKNSGSTASPLIGAIQWEPFGAARSWQWQLASGPQTHARVFDSSGRLVRYRLGPNVRDLSYDAADRISSYTHYNASTGAAQPTLNQSFNYDALGRLTQTTLASGAWSFSYDANSNRTAATVSGSPSTYTTAATSNRITSITNPSRSFAYDSAGNTTNDGRFSATYDLAGRMATLTKAGVTSTYSYDGFGRRVRKVNSTGVASAVIYVYGTDGQLLGEYDSAGTAIREYVWLGSTPVAVFTPDPASATNPPLVFYIHADHLDTPRVIVDKNNAIRWRWMAEPFGVNAPETNPSGLGVFTFNLRFPGQYFDQESGLHYNYFRSYDSSIGRYTTSDPIGLEGGINTYTYVDGRPIMMVDPLGLKGWYCQRPLGGEPGSKGPTLLNHQYLCVTRADGTVSCGGLTTDGNPLFGKPRLTRPDEDYYDPKSCKEVDDDKDRCFEQCVLRNFSKPDKPRYGIGPQGTDCQEYADDLYYGCKIFCNVREGSR